MLYPFVPLQSNLLLYWHHGFCDVSVTLCDVIVMFSKKTLDVHPRSDSTVLVEAVPNAETTVYIRKKLKMKAGSNDKGLIYKQYCICDHYCHFLCKIFLLSVVRR